MAKRARFGRDFVAVATIGIFAAAIAACDGGPGGLSQPGLGSNAPPSNQDYRGAVQQGPVVSLPGGGTIITPGGAPSPGLPNAGAPVTDAGPVGSGSCEAILDKIITCFPEAAKADLSGFRSECPAALPYAPPGCLSCFLGLACGELVNDANSCIALCGASGGEDAGVDVPSGQGGSSSQGKGGSSSGKGGTGGSSSGDGGTGGSSTGKGGTGGTGGSSSSGATCNDVAAAFADCDPEYASANVQTQIKATCSAFSDACTTCVSFLPCSELDKVAVDGPTASPTCGSVCK